MTWTLPRAVAAMSCALAGTAHAGSDHRWHDRFFWGLHAGAVEPTGDAIPAYGFEISYWPEDHVGLRIGTQWSAFADDWGLDVLGAVPLRYVQLYGGPHLGLRNPEGVDSGVDGDLHLTAGVQAYLGRNGRLFVEYQDPPGVRLGGEHADVVMAGLRWSPDFFHRARAVNKIDMVYEVALLSFIVWGIGSVSQ